MTGRLGGCTAAVLVSLLALGGCTGSEGATPSGRSSERAAAQSRAALCRDAVRGVVDATQAYVDRYAGVALSTQSGSASATPSAAASPVTERDLTTAVRHAGRVRRQQRCDPARFGTDLESGLGGVAAAGPVADAVLRQLRANLTGRVAAQAATIPVTPADDLAEVLSEAATGSTLELAAGNYRLDETIVLLRGVTLTGVGATETTITSSAGAAAVLVLTGDRVVLQALAVRHTGRSDASVVVGQSGASLQLSQVRLSGARLGKSSGGAGILMTAATGDQPTKATSLEVTGARLTDNEGAGIALTGTHRASVLDTDFRDNGQCGICFLGDSGGAVRDSRFTGNASAVAVTSAAAPTIDGNTIHGGQVGVQAADRSAPVLTDNLIVGSARAAVIYDGHAAGRADGTRCRDVPFGLVVGSAAHPFLGRNDCDVARGR